MPVSTGAIINISIDEDMAGSSITGSLEALVSTGADGVGRYGVDLNTLSPSLTSLTSNGVALAYTVVDNTLIAKAGLATIFTLAVNAQTGAYTFTQVGALDNVDRLLINGHAITPATALDTPGSHFALADVGGSNLAFEGRLADGDAIIRVTNDSNTDRTWTLDNHGAGPDYVLNIPAHTTWYVNVGNVADNTKFDLDGSGAPNGNTVVNPGHGDNIVAIDSDTSLALDLSSTVTVTDGDGDSVALNGQLIVTINDDVPVATGAAQTVTLSETGLPVVDVDFASLNINIGADSKNTHIEIGRDGNGNPIINNDLTSDGVPLEYLVRTANGVDQEIVAFKAGDTADHPVFIVSVLHPGSFAATLFQNLDHPADSDNISLNLVARVFDGDGDYVDQPFTINVADSAPTLVANTTVSGDVVEGGSTLETHSFASGAVNLAIPDVSTITSTITVPAGGSIHDVNVSINLTHTFMADLEITLIAPDGTRVRLVDDNGEGGDPNGTIKFDDEAASSFTAATQPYAGTWRPAIDQLSLFDGKSMAGTWTLEIRDDLGADVGTLRNWSLEIEASHDVSSNTIDLSSLVSVGADDANGAAVFALKTIATAENLGTVTAGGQQVKVISDGTTLTGYAEGAPATPLFTLTVSANGTATFTMHGEFDHAAGSDNLSLDLSAYVQAFDGDHDAVTLGTGQFVINVADSLPTAIDVAAAMSENESKSITLTEGTHYTFGADVSGAALSLGTPSYTGVPAGLILGTPSITLGADGNTISIVPGTAFDGLATGQTAVLHIPYTVTDGDHDAVTKAIAVTITGTNDAPVVSDAVTGAATEDGTDATLDALARASDVDVGTILSVTGVPGILPAGVIYDAATHSFTLDPSHSAYQSLAAGETTTVTVNYSVSDGAVSTPASVSWTITGTNDAPVVNGAVTGVATEDGAGVTLDALANASDVDAGTTLSVTGVPGTLPAGVIYDAATRSFTLDPSHSAYQSLAAGETTTVTVNYSVSDGTISTPATVSWTVTGTNDAPVVDLNGAGVGNDATTTAVEQLGQQFASQATLGDVDSSTLQSMTLTLAHNLDGAAESMTLNAAATAAANGLTVSYVNGILSISGTASIATYQTILRNVVYTNSSDNPDASIDRTVTVVVNDGHDNGAAQVATIHIQPLNDAPVAPAVTLAAIAEDSGAHQITTADLLAGATDVDGDTLTVSGLSASSGTLIDNGNGTWTFTPADDDDTSVSFSYTVSDGATTVPGSATLDLTPVNDAPVAANDSYSTDEDMTLHIEAGGVVANDKDVEQDALSSILVAGPSHGTLALNVNGAFDYTPDANYNGTDSFTYKVNDGTANSAVATVNITVNPVNDAPVIGSNGGGAAAAISVAENTTAVTTATATDVDAGSTLSYSITGGADAGKFTINATTGVLSFVSAPNFEVPTDAGGNNVYDVQVQVSDGTSTDTQSIAVTVTDVNEGSVAKGETIIVNGGNNSSFQIPDWALLANDSVNSGSLSISTVSSTDFASGQTDHDIDSVTLKDNMSLGGTLTYSLSGGGSVTDTVKNFSLGTSTLTGTSGDDVIVSRSNGDLLIAGAGDDVLLGNDGDDTLRVGTGRDIVDGGSGTDILDLSAATSGVAFTLTQSSAFTTTDLTSSGLGVVKYANIQGVLGTNFVDTISGSSDADVIKGGAGNDVIDGGANGDTLIGGNGQDTLTGGTGNDVFVFDKNDTGYDVITDFDSTRDALNFVNFSLANDGSGSINSAVTVTTVGNGLSAQSISGADLVVFNVSANSANSASEIASLLAGQKGTFSGGVFVLAYSDVLGSNRVALYYSSDADGSNGTTSLVAVFDNYTSVISAGAPNSAGSYYLLSNAIDPIILDLDHNGVALTSLDNGVQFDINADGHKDQIAWTAGSDGILAFDVDGNGKIDNGSEIFSPHFAGGSYVDGLAALSTLDSNHDGKIDATDEAFSKLTVWQDLNHNGITDSGELSSLADHSISSVSLDANASNAEINGQSILADGDYTLTDGSTGHFVEVAFDTTLGGSENGSNAYSLIGSDGDDTLSGSGGMFTISGGAGADTFVLDADALSDVKLADVITDFKASEGDTLDVSKLLDSLLGHEASEAEALASVKTTVSGADTVVSVNANGGWHDVAVLQNTTEAVKILFDDKHDTTTAPHVG
ncbi:cadherin-like domain-containing protein [Rhizobium sp. 3T7]|uniref:tandem-95 repeat protein n=1 Tax=Rhizobium sp. 3T7 TaxID=2874922 RepID=UPI001CC9F8A6|nr:tandem-95 repeat protein [Rhizobium sp. 3T7]MBZ9793910.1 cadherin-like domain-containing protein [Rhizobium sp. 3T7]